MGMPGFAAEAAIYRSVGTYLSHAAAGLPSELSMAATNTGSINCANCVGGDCAVLHCFENWVMGGGGAGGPYQGGGDGGGFGGGIPCSTDPIDCKFNCIDHVNNPCWGACVEAAGGNFKTAAFRACKARCDAANRSCFQTCRPC